MFSERPNHEEGFSTCVTGHKDGVALPLPASGALPRSALNDLSLRPLASYIAPIVAHAPDFHLRGHGGEAYSLI